ncbi:FHA domain-containing protein [Pyrobaculum neutrophilum]|uniref:FHA domain containing protein n=1 Tax=Pyrobaculum neutrophilum (strain DSM 2338 / JCM 9278 / NBRC 100436 / V24Sta) TaxID=444157 RepID=B1Y8L8_PYRNV|nr:FHA domain-containing protein [Pyrobaculum neutrophilum]ACB40097.1 FHA domain containing protein [Pyrobaculum neutrophilum V24Sta]
MERAYVVEVFHPARLVLRGPVVLEREGVYGREHFAWLGPAAMYISRRHFALKRAGGALYILDLGSTNGTYVNGVDIRGEGLVELYRGDVVNVAGVVEFAVEEE